MQGNPFCRWLSNVALNYDGFFWHSLHQKRLGKSEERLCPKWLTMISQPVYKTER
jgi:hypothetical protein